MAELAMLADIQRTVCPEKVTCQVHVMAQARESSPVIDRRSNHCATPPTINLISIICFIALHCGAKKLHRFIFAITFLNRDLFR